MSVNDRDKWDAQDLIQWQEARRWLSKTDEDLVGAQERAGVPPSARKDGGGVAASEVSPERRGIGAQHHAFSFNSSCAD